MDRTMNDVEQKGVLDYYEFDEKNVARVEGHLADPSYRTRPRSDVSYRNFPIETFDECIDELQKAYEDMGITEDYRVKWKGAFRNGSVSEIFNFDIGLKWFCTEYRACYGILALKKSADGKSVSCMLAIYNVGVERALRWWQIFTRTHRELGFEDRIFKDYVRYNAIQDFKKNRLLNSFLDEASKNALQGN
uniref:Uncharacterized protein LOC111099905 n=1 Tax=Crassostrea virginica TaxID=6565 RepID=A0A8B8A6M9_CRAVI|nr:uncharacterized protein LOC111099905 [Crassostrea virginica]XP_022287122.1 uncharacterized protein LOC111099905 [Crassostrea virginica]XP_022287123.1 uncharacterized protein LOC111099905 [Crassostrea virginica]